MRRGIVEGEPGSLPWGEWRLILWVRDHLARRRSPRTENQPEPVPEHDGDDNHPQPEA